VATIDIFLDGDDERRRKRRRAGVILIAIPLAFVIVARREGVVVVSPTTTIATAPESLSTITHTYGGTTLTPSTPAPPPIIEEIPARPPAKRPTPSPVRPPTPTATTATIAPAPVPTETVPVVVAPVPLPAVQIALDVTPRAIHFTAPKSQQVTITNPGKVPVRIDRVAISGAPGHRLNGYHVEAGRCERVTLRPGQSCIVNVIAYPAAIAAHEAIRIEVFHDGFAQPMP
jgi:hypothetical protein